MRAIIASALAALLATAAAAQGVKSEDEETSLPSAQGDLEQREDGGFTATGEARQANTMRTDVVSVITADPDFATLAHAVQRAGLMMTLKDEGPYTVFAPTNAAFRDLGSDRVDALMKDEDRLAKTLKDHVIAGSVMAADLEDGQTVETLGGATYEVAVDGDTVTIGGATVKQTDVVASNGVIHVVSGVLQPKQDGGQG